MKIFIIYRAVMVVLAIFERIMPEVLRLIETLVRAKDEILAAIFDEDPDADMRKIKDKMGMEVENEVLETFSSSPSMFSRGTIRMLVSAVVYKVGMERGWKRERAMEMQIRAGTLIRGDGKVISVFGVDRHFNPGMSPRIKNEASAEGMKIPEDYLDMMYIKKKKKNKK